MDQVPVDIARVLYDDEPLNEPLIATLMESMKTGHELPAPVLMQVGDGTYLVVDGRNRIKAAERLGATEFPAYVVEQCEPEKLQELRRGLNAHRGSN
jgi:ParB-like chromosome segregation protein Spo0J